MIDKNQVTGLVLILGILLSYQFFIGKEQDKANEARKAFIADSLKKAPKVAKIAVKDSLSVAPSIKNDTTKNIAETRYILENKDIKVVLSNIGGQVSEVYLKNFKTYKAFESNKNEPLLIFKKGDKITASVPFVSGKKSLDQINFVGNQSGQSVEFTGINAANEKVVQKYTLGPEGFVLQYNLDLSGSNLKTEPIVINWAESVSATEKDLNDIRQKSTINYFTVEEDFDNLSENPSTTEEENPELALKWVTFKKKYFLSGIIPTKNIIKSNLKTVANPSDSINLKNISANLSFSSADFKSNSNPISLYFGPNDLKELKKVSPDFDKNVYLGYEVFKPINKYIFVPLFKFLEKITSNYGLIILLLVLIIKLALTPLTYKSYVSMAKMKLLQPELNAIKEKVGDDAMKLQQEQMKLYNQVGVSPMSGCVPMLATLPILMSVFFLFPNLIEIRQKPFLWANDLSTFDSIINLPFKIPFYGSHVSLFTLAMTFSSLAYGYYNNQITPQQTGQPFDMRMMAYVTPVIFMFVMNVFPAGLSFYYFVSNIITVVQQLLIRKFVDNDKLKNIIEENRKKIAATGGPKKSKFSEYLQKSLAQAEEAKKQQNTKNPPKGKK